jgi:hypothetical protein
MDIDIDLADPVTAWAGLRCVRAAKAQNGERFAHISGTYFQDIPTDPLDGMSAWDDPAIGEAIGFFKIDFLAAHVYRGIRDEAHLDRLMNIEPPWELLRDPEIVSHLRQIHAHADLIVRMAPASIEELAACLALIRPGKRHLLKQPREVIYRDIWQKTEHDSDDGFKFKRAHAIAYAVQVVVQLNLWIEQAEGQS